MKRDIDIVRRIALETAKLETGYCLEGLEGVDKPTFAIHVIWMEEAGLVKARISEYISGEHSQALVQRLTWAGCEFADSVQDETLWSKAKEKVIKPSASFSFGILKDWLGAEIRDGFPTLRG